MENKPPKPQFNILIIYLGVFLALSLLIPRLIDGFNPQVAEVPYSAFKTALYAGKVSSVSVGDTHLTGKMADGTLFTSLRVTDPELIKTLEAQKVETTGLVESSGSGILGILLNFLFPLVMVIGLWFFLFRRNKGAGSMGNIFSFGKSKARMIQGEQTGVSFKDVGGAGEAVIELKEVTEFLKNPEHFQRLGGKMPKGVLLVGPPGTGKTLLARATAGEAGVQFFNLSGAEFVEMFVGVGASRVRDLFEQAKKGPSSIIFIDEIDAIGGRRSGAGAMGGGHEEREQTLNQLLAEMDGFETSRGVIVMAATNRPEILDPALLRPGRFDRQIMVDLPDRQGRLEILKIHTQLVTLAANTSLEGVSQITPGFSGADLANLVNEAALLASRRGKNAVDRVDFDDAFERVIAGSERRTHTINPNEKKVIAIHEAGHALVASLLPEADKVHKVTIVPRGRAMGYTMQLPTDDRYLMGERGLETRLIVLVSGRVAEQMVFKEASTGAMDDLARATDLARRMVTEYGMSHVLGPVRLAADMQTTYLNQQFGLDARVSPETATLVDAETRRIIEEAATEARNLLIAHRADLDKLADLLREQETVDGSQIDAILGRPVSPIDLDSVPQDALQLADDGLETSPDEAGDPVLKEVNV
jgi:cell division protease FtsH